MANEKRLGLAFITIRHDSACSTVSVLFITLKLIFRRRNVENTFFKIIFLILLNLRMDCHIIVLSLKMFTSNKCVRSHSATVIYVNRTFVYNTFYASITSTL